MNELTVCVFCYTIVEGYVCHECNDYKGLMPMKDAEEYLGEDLTDLLPQSILKERKDN